MAEFEPEIEIDAEVAGFKKDAEFEIGDTIKPEKRERSSYLDVCSRFGHVFVGRRYGFDVFAFSSLEAGDSGNGWKLDRSYRKAKSLIKRALSQGP